MELDPLKEKLVIEVKDKEDAVKTPEGEEPLGMLPTPTFGRHTYRRPKKTQDNFIYMRVFDGGLYASGTDIPFLAAHPPQLVVTDPSPPFGFRTWSYLPQDVVAPFNSFMLSHAGPWNTVFKEITPETFTRYGMNIPGLGGYDPAKGYLWSGGGQVSSQGGTAFRRVDTAASTYYKVTQDPDFNAPEVPFEIDRSCSLFLMPMVCSFRAAGTLRETPPFNTPNIHFAMGAYAKIMERSFCLNNPTFEAWYGDTMYKRTVNEFTSLDPPPLPPVERRNFFYDWVMNEPHMTGFRIRQFISFFALFYIEHTSATAGDMPRNGDANVLELNSTPRIRRPYILVTDTGHAEGLLVAACLKNGAMFYIWARVGNLFWSTSTRFGVSV